MMALSAALGCMAPKSILVKILAKEIKHYQEAEARGASEEELDVKFGVIALASHLILIRSLDMPPDKLMDDLQKTHRLRDLITPNEG